MWRTEFKNSDIFEQARGDGVLWTNGEDGLTQDHGALNKQEGRLNGKEANSFGGGSLRMFYSGVWFLSSFQTSSILEELYCL